MAWGSTRRRLRTGRRVDDACTRGRRGRERSKGAQGAQGLLSETRRGRLRRLERDAGGSQRGVGWRVGSPGATAFTRMPTGAHSRARDFVRLSTAARAAPVCAIPGKPARPPRSASHHRRDREPWDQARERKGSTARSVEHIGDDVHPAPRLVGSCRRRMPPAAQKGPGQVGVNDCVHPFDLILCAGDGN